MLSFGILQVHNGKMGEAQGKDKETEAIKISAFWEEQLKAMPYMSRKLTKIISH